MLSLVSIRKVLITDYQDWSGIFSVKLCFHWQGFTLNRFVLLLCLEQVSIHGPLLSTDAIEERIINLWLKENSSPSSIMQSSRALAIYLSNCKLFYVITNLNNHRWIYIWNTISIGSYPILCWNSEHPHGNLTVESRNVYDNYESLETRYVLVLVFHVSMSFV